MSSLALIRLIFALPVGRAEAGTWGTSPLRADGCFFLSPAPSLSEGDLLQRPDVVEPFLGSPSFNNPFRISLGLLPRSSRKSALSSTLPDLTPSSGYHFPSLGFSDSFKMSAISSVTFPRDLSLPNLSASNTSMSKVRQSASGKS